MQGDGNLTSAEPELRELIDARRRLSRGSAGAPQRPGAEALFDAENAARTRPSRRPSGATGMRCDDRAAACHRSKRAFTDVTPFQMFRVTSQEWGK
jgi:hypothetical protein